MTKIAGARHAAIGLDGATTELGMRSPADVDATTTAAVKFASSRRQGPRPRLLGRRGRHLRQRRAVLHPGNGAQPGRIVRCPWASSPGDRRVVHGRHGIAAAAQPAPETAPAATRCSRRARTLDQRRPVKTWSRAAWQVWRPSLKRREGRTRRAERTPAPRKRFEHLLAANAYDDLAPVFVGRCNDDGDETLSPMPSSLCAWATSCC